MEKAAGLEWRDGDVPISTRFDDPYYSLEDGLAETQHVFLAGNDIPERFRDGFHIAELGFGTGLNFLTTLQAFRESGLDGKLHFTSFEAFPIPMVDLLRALQVFPGLPVAEFEAFSAEETLPSEIAGADFQLTVVLGDARETLLRWGGRADAWFLDGFSPAKNPELWEAELMLAVGQHTATGGTFATYTAAGFVRRALEEAGFEVTRVPGYGRKRHMSRGVLR